MEDTPETPLPQKGGPVQVRYRNWRGVERTREITPEAGNSLRWGTTQWHPHPQWLLKARDEEGVEKEFALQDCDFLSVHDPTPATSGQPEVTSIVVRASNLDITAAFYEALGFTMTEEQHGNGPRHFACVLGSLVLEVYPRSKADAGIEPNQAAGVTVGFSVKDLDETVANLASAGHLPLTEPKDTPWGRRAVVLDPDGRTVTLSESISTGRGTGPESGTEA